MKRLWLLVALVLFANSAMGDDIVSAEQPAETISYCNINLTGEHQCSNYYKNKELQAVNIEKDRTFKDQIPHLILLPQSVQILILQLFLMKLFLLKKNLLK